MSNIAREVIPINIEDELKRSYMDYAMSVIISRALPDVRDGLKPVQRRILVAMNDLHLGPSSQHRKSAKIAGDTSGNYHPHGEEVIYPTMVRMAQDFNARYPLIDGQGNMGSIDGDPPAAMRYTEMRMSPFAMEMLEDLDKDTVDWRRQLRPDPHEPMVLPGKFPNLLANGSCGHRGRYGDQDPAAQPRRALRRPHPPDRQPRRDGRRPDAVHQGPGFPDLGPDPRHQGHHVRLRDRPRPDHNAGADQHRADGERQGRHRRHRAALPGQQGHACIEKIADLAREQEDRRHHRHPRLLRPPRHPASRSSCGATPTRGRSSTTCSSTPTCARPSASSCSRWSTASRGS